MVVEEQVLLAPLTTLHIGGLARFFVSVQTREDLQNAIAYARERSLPMFVLGGGSNVLVPDEGVAGLVLHLQIKGIEREEIGENVLLVAGAGESWDALVRTAVTESVWGIENLSGIPGSVGGAVVGNIGAYGQAVSQTCVWVEAYNIETGTIERLERLQCNFGYRESYFSNHHQYIVLRAAFLLSKTPAPDVSYKDLKELFGESVPTLQAIRDAVLNIRASKFPDLSKEGSAGSFFKNPILDKALVQKLTEKYPQMPVFSMPETDGVKVPLAWLLDNVLHMKGYREGGARLFEKQPLVVAATRGCLAEDVEVLAKKVAQEVEKHFSIRVEREVQTLKAI